MSITLLEKDSGDVPNPPSGKLTLYADEDGKLYIREPDGTTTPIDANADTIYNISSEITEDRTVTLNGSGLTLDFTAIDGLIQSYIRLKSTQAGIIVNPDTGVGDLASLLLNTSGTIAEFFNDIDGTGIKYANVTVWDGDTLITQDRGDGRYATAAQGSIADSALQNGDNVSELVNDAGYVTSSGGVVDSVTGDGVDNTDPANPILSFPDADQIDDTSTTNKFVTSALILLINSALQNGDNVSELVNDAGYITSENDTLQDVYSRGSDVNIDNTEGALKLSRGVGITDAAFNIVPSTVTPSTNLADGDFHVEDGTIFLYDLARTKFLSSHEYSLQFGKNNGVGNEYLRFGGDARDGNSGATFPFDVTIVAFTLQGSNNTGQSFDIEVDDVNVETLVAVSSKISDDTLDLDVDAGQTINLFARPSGPEVNDPYALIFVKRRKV
jgi:hypothetical protein